MESTVFFLLTSSFCMVMGLNGMENPFTVTVSQVSALHITRMPKDIHGYLMTFLTDYSSHNNEPSKFGTIRNIKSFMSTNRQFSSYDRDKVFMGSVLDFLCRTFPENNFEGSGFVDSQRIDFSVRIEHAFTLGSPGAQENIRDQLRANEKLHEDIVKIKDDTSTELDDQCLQMEANQKKITRWDSAAVNPNSALSVFSKQVRLKQIQLEKDEIKMFRSNIAYLKERLEFIEALKK